MSRFDIKITSSLDGFIPSIGLILSTYNPFLYIHSIFFKKTKESNYKLKRCLNCNIPFIAMVYSKKREQNFCCNSCANKFLRHNFSLKNKQLAYKIVDNKEFSKWFKTYNNRVIGYIYNNFESGLIEDLIDIWTDKSVIWYKNMQNKNTPFPYIKKALFTYAKNLKLNKKEVFYDECNIKIQNYVLGEINYEK